MTLMFLNKVPKAQRSAAGNSDTPKPNSISFNGKSESSWINKESKKKKKLYPEVAVIKESILVQKFNN